MKWANFFHIYQPAGQQPDILEAVVAQSYRPVLEGLKKYPKVGITMNISGVLLEMFDRGSYHDLLDIIRELVKEGRLELTGSAKYHALLPFLPEQEIVRQIEENNKTLNFYLGDYRPRGFFPPEMAYDPKIIPILEDFGFNWLILDEIAYQGKTMAVDYNKLYKIKNSKLGVYFREREPSNLIMGATVRSLASFKEVWGKELLEGRYLLTGMDGETFGHHRPGLEKLLLELFASDELNLVTISELSSFYSETLEIEPVKSTWASSEEEIKKGIQFLSWSDPDNEIHAWQKELLDLSLKSVYALDKQDPAYAEIRQAMDEALSSDQFWWASGKPWWSLEEIVRGAVLCYGVIKKNPQVESSLKEQASSLYEKIISTAFQWKESGRVYQMLNERENIEKIPFKERTLEQGGDKAMEYEAFLAIFKRLEKEAAEAGEYEKAILWRDSVWKIENKNDIYDMVHAVNLLRMEIPNHEVDKIIKEYQDKYRAIRGGQPEQRD